MLLDNIASVLKQFVRSRAESSRPITTDQPIPTLKSIGFDDFLAINMPPREMLLDPIVPERSLAMLYAPRGIGKTLLGLSIVLAVASGSPLLARTSATACSLCRWRNAACFATGTASLDFSWTWRRHSE
jgi:hypothetical protein